MIGHIRIAGVPGSVPGIHVVPLRRSVVMGQRASDVLGTLRPQKTMRKVRNQTFRAAQILP